MSADPIARTVLGLSFVGDSLPGLIPAEATDGRDEVRVTIARESDLEDRWSRAAEPRLLIVHQYHDGSPFMTVHRDPELGYRVWADGHGTHLLSADACSLLAAPSDVAPAGAVRLLASQVYPLLAALRGREPLHAGGVVIDGRVIGIAAKSGTGKSTTLWHLLAAGAGFFSDDVLVLEPAGGGVRAHPGPRLINIAAEYMHMAREMDVIGESDKVHLAPAGSPDPLPLGGIVFLERPADSSAEPALERVTDAARVLAHASLPYLETPDRLLRQFDVLGALSTTPLARVRRGAGESPDAVAARVREWASGLP